MIRALLRDVRTFAGEAAAACDGGPLRKAARMRHFGRWRATLREDMHQVRDRPWMTFDAIRFLQDFLEPGMRAFEYGMGSSTVFLARRCAELVSVEHDEEWFQRLTRSSAVSASTWVPLLRTPEGADAAELDAADPAAYASSDERFAGMTFRAYASAIDEYPDGHFDLVAVDGRARPSCLAHAAPRVRPGGVLLLDNAEREHYGAVPAELERAGWRPRRFCGPGPHNLYFWTTAVWRRPSA